MAHHPPHVFVSDSWYFVTASTMDRTAILDSIEHKGLLIKLIGQLADDFSLRLFAWVVLDNHYHLLLHAQSGEQLSIFVQRLHGRSAYEMNKLDGKQGRQVWHNYWDQLVKTERDFWTRFNYIHHNPVKHGYVKVIKEWKFSSYTQHLKTYGDEWMLDVWRNYPIVNFSFDGEV